MGKPLLTICVRCDEGKGACGEALYDAVRKLRKERGYKHLFDLDDTRCLKLCDSPCNAMFEGKKRSTYTRTELHSKRDAESLVEAARAYALLRPGEELPERLLPGSSAD